MVSIILAGHINPTRNVLQVHKEVNKDLKEFQKKVIKAGFYKPDFIPVYWDDNITTFRSNSLDGKKENKNF
jgi:hypothetical protein